VEDGRLFESLIQRYNEKHPHAQVAGRNFPSMDHLHAAILGAEVPHLALIDASWQAELIAQRRILPVEDTLNKIGVMARIILKADTFPIMWDAVLVGERVWTLPAFATSHALIYDVDRLREAGIKVPPKNWYEIILAARRMTRPSEHKWGFLLPTGHMSARDVGRLFLIYRIQAGALPGAGLGGPLDGPESEQVLQHWMDLVYKHKVAPPSGQEEVANAAMYVGTLHDLLSGQAQGRRVQAVPLPSQKAQASSLTVYSMALFSSAPGPVDRRFEAALWLTEFQQMLEFTLTAHYLPANKQITLSPGYFQYLQQHAGIRSFLAQLKNCRQDVQSAQSARLMDLVGESLKRAVETHMSPQEALSSMRQRAEVLLKQESGSPQNHPTGSGG